MKNIQDDLLKLMNGNSYTYKNYHRDSSFDILPETTDPGTWPLEWKKTFYKEYPRFPKFKIDSDLKLIKNKKLIETLAARFSSRDFTDKTIQYKVFSTLLECAMGVKKQSIPATQSTRFYPSAGARYPLESYLLIRPQGVELLDSGTYHYNVKRNLLERIFDIPSYSEFVSLCFPQEFAKKAQIILCISAVFDRAVIKYGERGYRFSLIEAGHLAQNVYFLSEALNLKCCALGGFSDVKINNWLEFHQHNEAVVYALAIGK